MYVTDNTFNDFILGSKIHFKTNYYNFSEYSLRMKYLI